MRIVHLTFSLPNAGKENMLVDIANEQFRIGHELAIIVINKCVDNTVRKRIDKGIKLLELNRKRSSKNVFPILRLYLFLKFKFRADVFHVHDPMIGKLLRIINVSPMVLTVHNTGMETEPMKLFKRIFAISGTVADDIKSRGQLRSKVIYNGIKPGLIRQKQEFHIPDTYRLIIVKRLDHKLKGQDILIRAMDILINEMGIKNLHLDIVGEGKSRTFLSGLINELHLQDHIFLLGNKSRDWVYDNLASYDMFIHPSRFEGFGLTVVESMAAKLPVISSDIEGPAEIIQDGSYGMLFKNEDYEHLASQIKELVKLYQNMEIIDLVEKAYHYCISNFNVHATAQNYCDSYFE